MKKHLFGVALTCLLVTGGIAVAQTIDDIQVYDPILGTPLPLPSGPYSGQTVTVTGILVERGAYSGSSGYLWNSAVDQGGISIYGSGGDVVTVGDEVSLTGVVGDFGGEIQIGDPVFTKISSGNALIPVPMTIPDILSDYENVGTYAEVIGTVTSVEANARFYMEDGGDTIQVYIDSSIGILLGAVDVGDVYQVTSPVVVYNGEIELKPTAQMYLIEDPTGDTVPLITDVNCANWVPLASDPIVVSATITDDVGVTGGNLYYRDNDGVTPGAWSSVALSNTSGDTWSGTIPGGHPLSMVDFYLDATDTAPQTVAFPGDAPASYFTVAVGMTSIYDMQYAHPDSSSQTAAMYGEYVNISGVVTAAGEQQVGASSKFIVQEVDPNPATDSYEFGAVLFYEGSSKYPYYQGDLVEIGGMCDEYFGQTEIIPHNPEAVNLVGFGSDLPPASVVYTSILSDDNDALVDGNGELGEAWESVWVQAVGAVVVDTTGFGAYNEMQITNTHGPTDSLLVDPLVQLSYVPSPGDIVSVTSWLDYNYGRYKMRPIDDTYQIKTGVSAVGDDVPTIEAAGGFRSVAPNPFNPSTMIKFVVNRENLVQLNIYNIRGQKVRTIVQGVLPAKDYAMAWDGTDDSGKSVASGSYFARLRIDKSVVQVRQMQLIK